MKKYYFSGVLLIVGLIFISGTLAQTTPPTDTTQNIKFRQAAVAPFLVGSREPDMDETMDQTLSCPINQICVDDPTIAPEAGKTLTRLTDDYLQLRFSPHIKSQKEVSGAFAGLILDDALDSPRTLAMKLGKILEVDAIFVGTVWRYRDRGAIKEIPDSPASVAFAIYLIDAQSGRQLWRGIFSVTQRSLTDNLFQAKKQFSLGLKWRSAEELARIGVKETINNLYPQDLP